ncbi:unnamed protein product [Phytophthora fragariaefolia]|uniref:Unnamed protein product n=1 Tax=Phytophthora fragariaefolia TaxID=1490495 RepID=A0A9W7CXZ2_9STRA|nr:unnamed protein product [Phytophthora fragariaefolia]
MLLFACFLLNLAVHHSLDDIVLDSVAYYLRERSTSPTSSTKSNLPDKRRFRYFSRYSSSVGASGRSPLPSSLNSKTAFLEDVSVMSAPPSTFAANGINDEFHPFTDPSVSALLMIS